MNYWEAVAIKTILLEKLNEGKLSPQQWTDAIADLRKAGFDAMASDLQKRYDHYIDRWLKTASAIEAPAMAESEAK
jgi:hypothetical protein